MLSREKMQCPNAVQGVFRIHPLSRPCGLLARNKGVFFKNLVERIRLLFFFAHGELPGWKGRGQDLHRKERKSLGAAH